MPVAHHRLPAISRIVWACFVLASVLASTAVADEPRDERCFELRVYTAPEGKLDALHARFRDHTKQLFEKHGIENIGYFTPLENPENKLYYVLAYPNRQAQKKSWGAFITDPQWLSAWKASEKDGKLVSKVESQFLHATDYSPKIDPAVDAKPRVFELRTYTCTPGNLARLNSRFRDHTRELFRKHGMTNLVYWVRDDDQPGASETLVYLLSHASPEAQQASFDAFRKDPAWLAAREASEKSAGGSLTVPDGVKSVLLKATDYSPLK